MNLHNPNREHCNPLIPSHSRLSLSVHQKYGGHVTTQLMSQQCLPSRIMMLTFGPLLPRSSLLAQMEPWYSDPLTPKFIYE